MITLVKMEALRAIHNGALAYQENLVHKNLMFVTIQKNTASCFEAAFLPRNFLHLTGVHTKLNSTDFFTMAVRDKLSERDFELTRDGTVRLKLSVLPSLMNIHKTARMAGDFNHSHTLLVTDKLAGTVTAAMGFKKNGGFYLPNTALNTDVRSVVKNPVQKIAAIFRKPKQAEQYSELTYIAKGLTIDDPALQPVLAEKVNRQDLTASFPIPQKQPGGSE